MTIRKSAKGNIYLNVSDLEVKWAEEVSGLTLSEDRKIAFFDAQQVQSLQDAARIFKTAIMAHGRYAAGDELQIWMEMKGQLETRAVELKAG